MGPAMKLRIYIWIAVRIALLLLFVETIRTDSLYLTVYERDSIHKREERFSIS